MAVTIEDIYEFLKELKADIVTQLSQRKILPSQVSVTSGLSEISEKLGLIQAGEFRAGNSVDPGRGFSGVRLGYPPFTYGGQDWNLVGVNNDKLQFGLSADDGEALAAEGLLKLNDGGMEVQSGGVAMRLTPVYATRPKEGWYIGGLNIGTSLRFGIHSIGLQGSAALIDDGFESGGLTGWTTTGSPSVVSTEKASGTYSCQITENDYISKTINVSSGAFYLIYIKVKTTAYATSTLGITGTNITSGYDPNPILINTDGVWATHLFLVNASSTTMTLNFRGWTGNSTTDPIYIDDVYVQEIYHYSYNGTLADGMGAYKVTASGGIAFQTTVSGSAAQTITMNGTGLGTEFDTPRARFTGELTLNEQSSTPSNPTSGTEARVYMKADKLVIQYNDGGTVRYKYLDLTGTGVTWVHTTSAP